MLLADWRVMPDRQQIVMAIKDNTFDPAQTALLEQPVSISPSGTGSAGTVQIHDLDSDTIELTINARRPSILVVTDNYSSGWQAVPIGTPGQSSYTVVPVDSVLRGIPLSPGRHHLSMQYRPASVRIGAWISTVSWVIFTLVGAGAILVRGRAGTSAQPELVPAK